MKKEIVELRQAIERSGKSASGRRQYGSELRSRVVVVAKQWRKSGQPLSRLSEELGLRGSILGTWLRKSASDGGEDGERVGRVRSVEVVGERGNGSGPLVLRFPNGAAVEGLGVPDIAFLLGGR